MTPSTTLKSCFMCSLIKCCKYCESWNSSSGFMSYCLTSEISLNRSMALAKSRESISSSFPLIHCSMIFRVASDSCVVNESGMAIILDANLSAKAVAFSLALRTLSTKF